MRSRVALGAPGRAAVSGGSARGTGGANVCGGQMKSTDECRGFFWLFARRWNVRRVLRYRRDGEEVSVLTSIWKAVGMQVSGLNRLF